MPDESDADDGGMYRFWEFVLERRRQRKPEFDLEDVARFLEALEEFEQAHS